MGHIFRRPTQPPRLNYFYPSINPIRRSLTLRNPRSNLIHSTAPPLPSSPNLLPSAPPPSVPSAPPPAPHVAGAESPPPRRQLLPPAEPRWRPAPPADHHAAGPEPPPRLFSTPPARASIGPPRLRWSRHVVPIAGCCYVVPIAGCCYVVPIAGRRHVVPIAGRRHVVPIAGRHGRRSRNVLGPFPEAEEAHPCHPAGAPTEHIA